MEPDTRGRPDGRLDQQSSQNGRAQARCSATRGQRLSTQSQGWAPKQGDAQQSVGPEVLGRFGRPAATSLRDTAVVRHDI
ncbi:unnamed protein product [Merluccius merluccius]